nr:hypothetical protein [Corynebacterium accolens]
MMAFICLALAVLVGLPATKGRLGPATAQNAAQHTAKTPRAGPRKRDGATVRGGLMSKLQPSARLFMTILLGSMRFPWPVFLFFDTIGVMLWVFQALAIGYVGGMAFSDTPLFAMVISIIAAIFIGLGLQKAQNSIMEWWDTRRGYAETP